MKTARPTPRKLPIQCASRRVGDCEHAFVDGVRVCLPWNPGGSWYWALEGDLIPMRPFRPEPDAAGTPCGPRLSADEIDEPTAS